MRTDLGPLRDDDRVDMGDHAAARAHALRRIGKEDVGGGALPLRIGGREVGANVAIGQRTENGVGHRMHQHVGVGMAEQLLRVRNGDAAEPDMVAVLESMHVVA